mgnify:CR=1 FL=1
MGHETLSGEYFAVHTTHESERKENKRDSTKEILTKFKERVKNVAVQDKVKEKHHEHER